MKELKEYYSTLGKHIVETKQEYQKVILFLAGGALTLSLTFSDKIASTNSIPLNLILVLGWAAFLSVIGCQIRYYIRVTKHTNDLSNEVLAAINSKSDDLTEIHEKYQLRIKKLDILNTIALWLLLVGLVAITVFFTVGIFYRGEKNNIEIKTSIKRGICADSIPSIVIENNPTFINNNGVIDTTTCVKKIRRIKKKPNPCP